MDGRLISRTGSYPELLDPALLEEYQARVDIVTDHLYPLSVDKLQETASTAASLYGLPLVLGEFGWTETDNVDVLTFLQTVEQLNREGQLSGSLFWSMFGHAEIFGDKQKIAGTSVLSNIPLRPRHPRRRLLSLLADRSGACQFPPQQPGLQSSDAELL